MARKTGANAGQYHYGGTIYNGGNGNTLNVERLAYTGTDVPNGTTYISNEIAQFPSPWGLEGVAEVSGDYYGIATAGNPSNVTRLYTLDPNNGNILTTIDTDATGIGFSQLFINDLTSSYAIPEPATSVLALTGFCALVLRRRRA